MPSVMEYFLLTFLLIVVSYLLSSGTLIILTDQCSNFLLILPFGILLDLSTPSLELIMLIQPELLLDPRMFLFYRILFLFHSYSSFSLRMFFLLMFPSTCSFFLPQSPSLFFSCLSFHVKNYSPLVVSSLLSVWQQKTCCKFHVWSGIVY